jgi:Zn-finger nucleic acid-binding protein
MKCERNTLHKVKYEIHQGQEKLNVFSQESRELPTARKENCEKYKENYFKRRKYIFFFADLFL